MEAKHTPGPWQAERIGAGYHSGKEKGMAVRITAPNAPDDKTYDIALTYYKPTWEEADANARLIAAAPDLLQACRAAVIDLSSDEPPTPATLDAIYEHLQDAIAKAEGSTNETGD